MFALVLWIALVLGWVVLSPLDGDGTLGAAIAWSIWYWFLAAVAWLLHAVGRGLFRALRG